MDLRKRDANGSNVEELFTLMELKKNVSNAGGRQLKKVKIGESGGQKLIKTIEEIEIELQETNLLDPNFYKGINEVCELCLRDCKQFENALLINCPKIKVAKKSTK